MSAVEIVQELLAAGAILEARGDTLYVEAPRGLLTPEKREALTAHKRELLDWLSRRDQGSVHRVVVEYQLADTLRGARLVLLGAPGESYEDAGDGLRRRYGERLLNLRPYYKGAKR